MFIDVDGSGEDLLPILDKGGFAPTFDYSEAHAGFEWKSESFAVEALPDDSFVLAIKHTNKWGNEQGQTEIDWQVLSIDSDGILDFDSEVWGSIAPYEKIFNQDLNEDGSIGIALTYLQTTPLARSCNRY